jgi:hypothetical protein
MIVFDGDRATQLVLKRDVERPKQFCCAADSVPRAVLK